MFTDLAGSTEIRSRVGEDAAETLRAVHDEVLSDAIAANGGVVVKHLGDGRMQIRLGISTGDVTFDRDDCSGLPVVEAQRLEASAEPATIRCAEMVMLMERGRGGHEFASLGDLDLPDNQRRLDALTSQL